MIGCIYYYGYGVQKDFSKALDSLTKAAQPTHNLAVKARVQIIVGYIYHAGGFGIEKDPQKALDYLNFAATQPHDMEVQTHAVKALEQLRENKPLPELREIWSTTIDQEKDQQAVGEMGEGIPQLEESIIGVIAPSDETTEIELDPAV